MTILYPTMPHSMPPPPFFSLKGCTSVQSWAVLKLLLLALLLLSYSGLANPAFLQADAPTATLLTSSLNPSFTGNSVTITATVTSGGNPVTQGTVSFFEGVQALATNVSLNGSGQATFSKSNWTEGSHLVTANYTGTTGFAASSGTLTQTVNNVTTIDGTTFCNEGGITINDNGVAMPYPSRINVSGLTGTVQTVTITLKNLTHTAPDDIDLLLYSPTGQKFVFMSDAGGTNAVTDLDLIFDSSAASSLPDNTTLVSGTFRPADFEVSADAFPAPAPAGPYTSASTTGLGTLFVNTNPIGAWYLYAVDDAATNTGSIGGWCLNFTMSCTNSIAYVNASVASSGNGTTWGTAFKTLQEALTAANNCPSVTQIWVAKGTYYPDEGGSFANNDRTSAFTMKNGVAIYGGFSGNGNETMLSQRNWAANPTILSGDIDKNNTLDNGNSYNMIFNNNNGLNNSAVLDGFTITGGLANGTALNGFGGGMCNFSSSPSVTNCSFSGNQATSGGGMANLSSSNPTLTNCSFSGNQAASGGGMANLSSSPSVTNCSFSGNQAGGGGGMFNELSNPTVTNCTFSGNNAVFGGGIYNNPSTNPTIKNSIFWGNIQNGSTTAAGADFYNYAPPPGYDSSPVPTATLSNSLLQLANNTTNYPNANFPSIGASNNLFAQDPLFVNSADPDGADNIWMTTDDGLALTPCSPAINVGDNTGAPATDILGNARPYVGTVSTADMGAYEFQGDPIVITAPTVTQPTCTLPTGTIVVNATGSGTLEYSINNGTNWQPGATFTGLSAGNYTLKVRTQGSPSCEVSYGSNPIVLASPFTVTTTTDTWTGCVSTNWNTAGNWQDGSVPTAADDVVIPSAPTNQPTLSTTATAKSVEVRTGASLSITNSGSLTINGSKTVSGFAIAFYNSGTVVSEGQVILGNTASVGLMGIWNNGSFTNNGGAIIIDRVTNQGINNGSTFTNTGAITIGASVSGGIHGIWNQNRFDNTGGSITIDRTTTQGVYNTNTFNNSGLITIGATAITGGQGVNNSSSGIFNNKTGGLLTINRSTGFALENFGTLDNIGTIRIGNITSVADRGIVHRNGGTLNNKPGGLIQIDRTSAVEAFFTSGVVNNEATIEIGSNAAVTGIGVSIVASTGTFNNKTDGLLTINGSTIWGMENKGTLDNSGTIRVGNIASVGAICIVHRSGGTFNNKTGGAIYMDRTTAGGQALYSSGLVNNEGSIKIGSNATVAGEGIRIEGDAFNNKTGGNIQIDQTGSYGILLLNSGTVFNNEALIEIGSQSDVKGDGIRNGNGCTFNNKVGGDIYINRIGISGNTILCIINFGTFNNDAKITIGNIGLVFAQDGIYNAGSFTNNAAGIISIAKPWGNGVWNISGTFQNAGKINISNVVQASGNFSTGILSTAPFSNTTNAEIHLDLVGSGIITTNTFTNAGLIRMGENGPLTGSGIANVQGVNAVFNNNAGGDISIKQTAVDGVQNDANSTFNNNACAVLTMADNLNNAGIFTNSGLFTVNTTQAHTNTALTNNGVIEYPQGNPIPNVTNNDLIANSVSGCVATVTNALQIGGMNSFTVGTAWFKDQALTQPAGTYDPNTNTFTANGLAVGNTHQLYFSITDPVNMCARTVSIPVTLNSLPTASILNTNSPICTGGNASFTVNGTNGATLTYTLTGIVGNQTLLLDGSNQTITTNNAVTDITLTLVSVTKNNCDVNPSVNATVTVYPLPTDFSLSGGGISFCQTPLSIATAGSQIGVSYQLKRNNVNFGSPIEGTGNPLIFANLTQAGTYTILAKAGLGNCSRTLSAEIIIQTRNAPNAFNLSGGGASCSGAPVNIQLSNSQIGVLYQLKRGSTPVGSSIPGTGNALSFPPQNTAGNYSVTALTQCPELAMNNTVTINSVVTPNTFQLTGGGTSCGTALPVGLSDSQSGVFYQLLRNNTPVGTTVQGTGQPITLGNHLTQGQYTVVATRAGQCPTTMQGNVLINLIDPPALFNVIGGGTACPAESPLASAAPKAVWSTNSKKEIPSSFHSRETVPL